MSEGASVLGPIGELRAHAIEYATQTLDVFPVNPRDKTPLTSQYQATTNTSQIEEWWDRWPAALIGHRIASEHLITDIDPRHGGIDTWQALKNEIGTLPHTRVHQSGRGDMGMHFWWQHPHLERLNVTRLDAWARDRGVGHQTGARWTCGIDLLHHGHRYTILPPSPHPETRRPYQWLAGRDLAVEPAAMPQLLVELITPDTPTPPVAASDPQADSIADWYRDHATWTALLAPHGWTIVKGDGDSDGSAWRHPQATSAISATINHGCLFVYSTSTAFEPTNPSDPHGYTKFHALAVLEHAGDQSAAARALRSRRTPDDDLAWVPGDGRPPIGPPAAQATGPLRPFERVRIDLRTPPTPTPMLGDWLYGDGCLTVLQSEPGVGKSWLALVLSLDTIAQGGDVIYIDEEGGRELVHERLAALGADPDQIDAHFHYYPFPTRLWDDEDLYALDHMLAAIDNPKLGVLDSLPDFLAIAGQDEDRARDVTRFVKRVCGTFRQARCSQLLLDHLPKPERTGKPQRSRYSRGSGAKLGKADATLLLEAENEFDEHTNGTLRLWKTKDRRGRLQLPTLGKPGRGIAVAVGKTTVTFSEIVDVETGPYDGPTDCMNAVLGLLQDVAGTELNKRRVIELMRAAGHPYRDSTIAEALDRLALKRAITYREGPRNSHLYAYPTVGQGGPATLGEEHI